MARACPQCGNELPDRAKFCGQCGAVTEVGPPTDPAPAAVGAPTPNAMSRPAPSPNPLASTVVMNDAPANDKSRTRMEFAPDPTEVTAPLAAPAPAAKRALSSTLVMDAPPAGTEAAPPQAAPPQAAPPQAAPPQAVAPPSTAASAPRLPTDKRTMIGINAADLLGPAAAPPPAPASLASKHNTMLGVAMPGIAPIQPGVPKEPAAPVSLPSKSNTMLGVAMPGIAPIQPGAAPPQPAARPRAPVPPPVDIVPAPPPLVHHEPAPAGPPIARKRGIPIVLVALLVGVLLVGGLTIVFFLRSAPPLSAKPDLDNDGKEVLRLRCEACSDGTKATFNGITASFSAHDAVLPLKLPLHVGDNPIELKLDRPGMGRDETVKLTVPVQFRIHADLGTVDAAKPTIAVRVEALPGTDVRVDDKPLALDASGVGVYAIDLAPDAEGAGDERRLRKEVPYVVTPKGGAQQKGVVVAQVTVLPLRVDTPGTHAIVDAPSFVVAGRAYKSSTVTVNGQPATMNPEGFFEATVAAASPGDVAVEVKTSSPTFVPRTVRFTVKRVAQLDAEAKALEAASPPGYDAVIGDLASKSGQPFIVDGEVIVSTVDAKVHRTVMVVDDRRGCAKGPCVVRVVLGREEKLAAGDAVRAYGRITRGFTMSDGKTAPEIEADFLLRGRGKR